MEITFIQTFNFYILLCGESWNVSADKTSMTNISTTSSKIVYPDTSKMVIYDPKHTPGTSVILLKIGLLFGNKPFTNVQEWCGFNPTPHADLFTIRGVRKCYLKMLCV